MIRGMFVCTAALLLAVSAPLSAGAQGVEGNYRLAYVINGNLEASLAIFALKTEGGKTTGELVTSRLQNGKLKSVSQENNVLRIAFQGSGVEIVFEGPVPKDASKTLLGSMSVDATVYAASLNATEDAKVPTNAKVIDCPPFLEARKLSAVAAKLRQDYLKEKDNDKRGDLLKQYVEADTNAKKETPRLYREVFTKFPDSPVVFEAGLTLLRSATANSAKPDDVKKIADAIVSTAKGHGTRWQAEMTTQIASALVGQETFAAIALEYAREAEKGLTDKTPDTEQVRVLSVLSQALRKNKKADEAAKLEVRVEKLEETADRAYKAKMPGFKGEVFAGRQGKSERAVFMELFTGATCPPCVAADLAFDVLQSTYKPSELVLLQYHMHIPGPDPLTNADTEARWAYYRKLNPGKVNGVPSSLFNGQPKAGGGGGAANAEAKYGVYRKVIDELIEADAGAKIALSAERSGDKIDINVKVTGVNDPGSDKKLRILLAEETVRYLGSNKIRLHHNVVRAFPGGVKGHALTEAASKHNATVNLGDLRTQLTKYLDEFESGGRSFANPSRPMALNHLRVIAFVQDDSTGDILQAAMVEVKGK